MPTTGIRLAALVALTATGAAAQEGGDPLLMQQGAALYDQNCTIGHKEAGQGTTNVFPPLAGSE